MAKLILGRDAAAIASASSERIAALRPDMALSEAELDRLDADAAADRDNPEWSEDQLAACVSARVVRRARVASGLDQPTFARTFGLDLVRLQALEGGQATADGALLAYLRVIAADPARVQAILAAA